MTTITHLTGTATFTAWDEDPGWDSGAPVPRLARVQVTFAYHGDIEATSTSESVMHYTDEAIGVTVGVERVEGRVEGRPGACALRHEGTFGPEGVEVRWSVVPGSGTGTLAGVTGTGGYSVPIHDKEWSWHLDLER